MLTKEEADMLYEIMDGIIFEKRCQCLTNWPRLHKAIIELTEKPKIEIIVGEIYWDSDYGFVRCMSHREELCKDNPQNNCTGILFLRTGSAHFIRHDGTYLGKHGENRSTLDLNKRYEFVEKKE
jgi:hypothetical protein